MKSKRNRRRAKHKRVSVVKPRNAKSKRTEKNNASASFAVALQNSFVECFDELKKERPDGFNLRAALVKLVVCASACDLPRKYKDAFYNVAEAFVDFAEVVAQRANKRREPARLSDFEERLEERIAKTEREAEAARCKEFKDARYGAAVSFVASAACAATICEGAAEDRISEIIVGSACSAVCFMFAVAFAATAWLLRSKRARSSKANAA